MEDLNNIKISILNKFKELLDNKLSSIEDINNFSSVNFKKNVENIINQELKNEIQEEKKLDWNTYKKEKTIELKLKYGNTKKYKEILSEISESWKIYKMK